MSDTWTGPLLASLLDIGAVTHGRALQLARACPDPSQFSRARARLVAELGEWARSLPDQLPPPASPRHDVSLTGFFDQEYPALLRRIQHPPAVLWARGTLESLRRMPGVAVVGTRSATPWAREMAAEAGRIVVDAGMCVVSGLATGCDTAAHEAAVAGGGATVAFVGGAIVAGAQNEQSALADRIVDAGGAIVSENGAEAGTTAARLVARDRLQSGSSITVVVIQARGADGTMHTARFALQQQRTLIVLRPPDVAHPDYAGSRALVDPAGCDPAMLHASGSLGRELSARRPVADVVLDDVAQLAGLLTELREHDQLP